MSSSLLFIACISGTNAFSQVNPSATLLLNNVGTGKQESGFDSGRYTIRPKGDTSKKDEVRPSRKAPAPAYADDPAFVEVPDPLPQEASSVSAPSVPPPLPGPVEVVVGGGQEASAPVIDPRRVNLLEIDVAPAYIYTNSDSNYYFRRYNSAGSAFGIQAKVWLNPDFAVHANFLGSLDGHVTDSLSGSKNVAATQQWFDVGIRSRKFFGTTVLAPTLALGLDYSEYQLRVPADAVYRGRLTSTGAVVSLEAEVPTSGAHAYQMRIGFAPKLMHSEAAAATNFQSGSGVDANSVEIGIGSRLRFDREHAVFWSLTHIVEKNLFSGKASVADPQTATIPSGVAVTNSMTILRLGYTWGN
jgi:hypothetical protein